jgi:hypothetical protein
MIQIAKNAFHVTEECWLPQNIDSEKQHFFHLISQDQFNISFGSNVTLFRQAILN